ncbi:stage III sporulation protein AG [Paenibacillus sabuli]|uniref:stage III sporulation protein AG n=1 Tax=Paenibacillus sabuli TaxID=2772509 RepID=UPI00295BC7E2|nr:stage III sporulation protein AG [Paenibacillus sabuli]
MRTLRWLLLIAAAGIGLMLLNSFLPMTPVEPANQPSDSSSAAEPAMLGHEAEPASPFAEIERPLEERLEEMLAKIVGVGAVDVMITVESTEETIIERNVNQSQQTTEETDRDGGKRRIASYTKDGQVVLYELDGQQTPIVTKRINPTIRGILIVARGAEHPTVKKLILDAVQKGYNVPEHRISIVPSKQP